MTLEAGFRLGPYEVIGPLGSGGMGEVYRARDTRLGRDVAIKTLPAEVSGHPDLLRRFECEARAASALNHPNIVTIHDAGREGDRCAPDRVAGGERLAEWARVAVADPAEALTLYPVDSGAPQTVPGARPGETPVGWSRDGSALYVAPLNEVPTHVARISLSDGRRTPFRELAPSDPAGVAAVDPIVDAPDGNAYAYSCLIYLSTLYVADGLR